MDYALLESFDRTEPYSISAIPVSSFKKEYKLNDFVTAKHASGAVLNMIVRGELFDVDPKQADGQDYFFRNSIHLISLVTPQNQDFTTEVRCLAERYALDIHSNQMDAILLSLSKQQQVSGDLFMVSSSYMQKEFQAIAFVNIGNTLKLKNNRLMHENVDITDIFNPEKVGFGLNNGTKPGSIRRVGSAMFTQQTLERYLSRGVHGSPHSNYRAISLYSEKDVTELIVQPNNFFSK